MADSVSFNGQTVTFTGSNVLSSAIVGDNLTGMTHVIIEGYSSIGDNAFNGASSLTSITIPDTVTSIGQYAFSHATSLTDINIPDSVTSIKQYAFQNATSLSSITIPDSVTSMRYNSFIGATSLSSITLSASVTSIEDGTFSGATSLTSITIPDGVTSIGVGAFLNATSLTSINIPEGVTIIGDNAFEGTTNLTEIIIPDTVNNIGGSTFRNSGLKIFNIESVNNALGITSSFTSPISLYGGVNVCIYFLTKFTYIDGTTISIDISGQLAENNIIRRDISSVTCGTRVTSIGDFALRMPTLTSVTFDSNS